MQLDELIPRRASRDSDLVKAFIDRESTGNGRTTESEQRGGDALREILASLVEGLGELL